MSSNLHVLIYGTVETGVCDYYRFGLYRTHLLEHGVEVRPLTGIGYSARHGQALLDATADDDFTLDRTALDWADVIVFRRFYQTAWNCQQCVTIRGDRVDLERHREVTGHPIQEPDPLVRPLLRALEASPKILNGRAVVYESDDNLLNIHASNGISARMAHERDQVERLLRRADLVTTTTPVLANAFLRYNDEVRVVRNAIDTSLYEAAADAPAREGDPRLLFYGHPVRWLNYRAIRPAVDEAKARHPNLRRVWFGTRFRGLPGPQDASIDAAMDETEPFRSDVREFGAALAGLRPHIGVAPLSDHDYDRSRSELHWLEYSAVGAATVATRLHGGGPFDVVRNGVDGFLARGAGEWRSALLALAGSATLREEMAGRARERVRAEYDVRVRAPEWAAAYRWAAEHPGRGARPPAYQGWSEADAVADARAGIVHRAERRASGEADAARLAAARAIHGGVAVCPPAGRVSILIPVLHEPPPLVARAIASVAAQDHASVEAIIAVPTGWPRHELPATPGLDIRFVVYEPTVTPAGRDADPIDLARALNAAAAEAAGAWVAPLSPEGEMQPDHVSSLLGVAVEHELEFVYGQSAVILGDDAGVVLGSWPPGPDFVLTLATELFARALLQLVPYDQDAWREGETVGWAHWRRLIAAGVRLASIELRVHSLSSFPAAA